MRGSASATPEQVAAFGPFFAVTTHAADSPLAAPWRPMGDLVRDPGVLRDRVAAVRARLASGGRPPEDVELRVAASVTHLGLVARLLSPALAIAALNGTFPQLELDQLRWQPVLGGGFPLSLPREALSGPPPGATGDTAVAGLLDGPVRDLVDAVAPLSVSRRILWGNTASAVNGAAAAAAAVSPARGRLVREAAGRLLGHPLLRAAHLPDTVGGEFRRSSCCLIYRAAPDRAGGLCGDCVLRGSRPATA